MHRRNEAEKQKLRRGKGGGGGRSDKEWMDRKRLAGKEEKAAKNNKDKTKGIRRGKEKKGRRIK